MFTRRIDAENLNSVCSFCNREKFLITFDTEQNVYNLVRCTNEACILHCKWGHEVTHVYIEASEDHMGMIRGN